MQKYFVWLAAALLAVACTKDGDTIYLPDPHEEQASSAPLVTVIYGDNSLGDRSYCDMIYEGVERTAQELGLRTMQLSPRLTEEGLQYLELMMRQMETAQDTVRRLFIVTSPVYDEYLRNNSNRLAQNYGKNDVSLHFVHGLCTNRTGPLYELYKAVVRAVHGRCTICT